jgi:NADPH-dependent 2,4-dienoyl-CoA reductase/sulfur reductase-like enzyme
VELRLNTQLKTIEDDGHGCVGGVVTDQGERLACEIVGLTAGVSPNLDLVRDSGLELGRGILVDKQLRTSVPDVYAAGDCAEIRNPGRNLLQQVWYTGKMQGEHVADVLCGEEKDYDSGLWFNSAKFFDLEYQTYGRVNLKVPGEANLYWEHESGRKALRLVHLSGQVIGINVMGLRLRHEVCERWLAEGRSVEHVLARLDEANFDPEFFARHEAEIAAAFGARVPQGVA